MLKKIISHISKEKVRKENVNFFDLPVIEQQKIIQKAAELSAQDQKDLLKEYEQKFGELQTNSCK
jgi:TRAP-type C4-dicarboxylate transport system substrate-binding protein